MGLGECLSFVQNLLLNHVTKSGLDWFWNSKCKSTSWTTNKLSLYMLERWCVLGFLATSIENSNNKSSRVLGVLLWTIIQLHVLIFWNSELLLYLNSHPCVGASEPVSCLVCEGWLCLWWELLHFFFFFFSCSFIKFIFPPAATFWALKDFGSKSHIIHLAYF